MNVKRPAPVPLLCKWSIAIIARLDREPACFSELARGLHVSNRILIMKLRKLMRLGLVAHKDGLSGAYYLTGRGQEIAETVQPLITSGVTPLELQEVLRCKWMREILVSLVSGEIYASQIVEKVNGISWKVLSERLKKLERFKMIQREVLGTRPVRVRYSLGTKGKLMVRWLLTKGQSLTMFEKT